MISNTSATVFVEHVQTSEVPEVVSLVAKLGASMDMAPNGETATQDMDIKFVGASSSSALASLVLVAAAVAHKSPAIVLQDVKMLIAHNGFDVDSVIG